MEIRLEKREDYEEVDVFDRQFPEKRKEVRPGQLRG